MSEPGTGKARLALLSDRGVVSVTGFLGGIVVLDFVRRTLAK